MVNKMEKKEVLYAIDMNKVTTYSLLGVALGLVLTFVPMSYLLNIIVLFIGLTVIVVNGAKLYSDIKENKNTNETLIYALGILAGFLLIILGNKIANIVIAIYLILEPILMMGLNKFSKNSIIDNTPRILIGIVLLFSGFLVVDIGFKILGIIILVGSLIYLGINYYLYKKSGVKIIEK